METTGEHTEHDAVSEVTDVEAMMVGRVVVPYDGSETVEQITSAARTYTVSPVRRDMPA